MAYGDVDNQVQAYESKGLASLKQMQQTNPKLLAGIAIENLTRDMQERERADKMSTGPAGASVIDKKLGLGSLPGLTSQQAIATAAPGLEMQGQQMKAQQGQSGMQPSAQMGAPNMARQMAGGGIVEYAQGGALKGAVPPSPVGDPQIKMFADQYNALKQGLAAATTPEDKAQSQLLMQELIQGMGNQHGAVMQYIDSTKGFAKMPTKAMGMGKGGIVEYAKGGHIRKFQEGLSVEGDPLTQESVTETGEIIVALAGPNSVPVTEEEYIVFTETGQLPANRNDRRYSTPTPATPLTAEQTWLKRMDQMDQKIGPIIGGETGLVADMDAIGNKPDFSWQEKVGGGYEVGAEALGKLIGKTGATAGITGEYLLRSLGLGASGAGQTGVLGEGVEAVKESIETLSEPSRRKQIETAFNEQMADLEGQMERLRNNPDIFNTARGQAAMETLVAQQERLVDGMEASLSQVSEGISYAPSSMEGVAEGFADMLPNNVSELADFLAGENRAENKQTQQDQEVITDEEERLATLNEASALARENDPGEITLSGIARAIKDGSGSPIGQQQDAQIRTAEKKGIADLMQSDNAKSILDVIRKLGYAGGASKGYEGQALFQGIQAERDAETKAGRDRDMLDAELDARLSMMREEQGIRAAAAQGMDLAEYTSTLDDNTIMNSPKYQTKKAELERTFGKGARDLKWYSRKDKEEVDKLLATYAAGLKAEMIAAYKAQLGAFNPTNATVTPPVASSASLEGWGPVGVTP